MEFLGCEAEVDAHYTTFGDVDGDQVEDIADCDKL